MAKYNARDWIFQATPDPEAGTPVWTQIEGVNTFTLSRSANEATVETTDFDSAGEYEGQAMQRGASLQLAGQKKLSAAGTDSAPGQKVCNDLAQALGEASLGGVRFRHISEEEWEQWTAYASSADEGGGNNDKSSWGATFTRSGAKSTVAVTP